MAGFQYGWGVGPTLFHRLVHGLGSPCAVFLAPINELLRIQGTGDKVAGVIKKFDVDSTAESELRLLEKEGIRVLTLESSEYPSLLESIKQGNQ